MSFFGPFRHSTAKTTLRGTQTLRCPTDMSTKPCRRNSNTDPKPKSPSSTTVRANSSPEAALPGKSRVWLKVCVGIEADLDLDCGHAVIYGVIKYGKFGENTYSIIKEAPPAIKIAEMRILPTETSEDFQNNCMEILQDLNMELVMNRKINQPTLIPEARRADDERGRHKKLEASIKLDGAKMVLDLRASASRSSRIAADLEEEERQRQTASIGKVRRSATFPI
ncbi:hypothetical protein QFC22_005989 [Naganishia vaughanmartiniae]|uniref:Uncharacterized protein n=1 Tax=Naganishia vaughanmartiniae TaxID=1424756 RepID=A0ACC2WPI8_9TREE|nr:hypothetical protein QFC22_005989 [Naganishia vaughanmartiniae]